MEAEYFNLRIRNASAHAPQDKAYFIDRHDHLCITAAIKTDVVRGAKVSISGTQNFRLEKFRENGIVIPIDKPCDRFSNVTVHDETLRLFNSIINLLAQNPLRQTTLRGLECLQSDSGWRLTMSGIWPGETQCVVLLGFDIDGVSSWLNRDPSFKDHPSLMSMAEYGPSVATPRILDMLDAHSVQASFYVPGYVAETHEEMVAEIFRRGHEIAHHGYMHEPPSSLTREQEIDVIESGIRILSGITGEQPLGYRSPSWELSEHSLELLTDHGFIYDSSLMGDDAPYIVESPTNGKSLVELPVHWLLDDAPNFVYAPVANRLGPMRNPDEVYQTWAAEFEGLYRYGRAFTLTMHPQYIGRPGRLLMLERLIEHIKSFPNVEFMRAIDVAEMWR